MRFDFLLIIFWFFGSSNLEAQVNLRHVFQPADVVHEVPYGANAAVGNYVETDDAKIYYEVYGEGTPLAVLHGGIFGSTIEMADFINKLKDDYQVIAISTRGHGKSEIGKGPITYEKKARDVMSVLEIVTQDPVILLGFSDGAYTGYKVASMFPEKIQKLIAIGAGEQIPGLRKVVFNTPAEAFRMDSAYWQQQLKLMPEPDRLKEFWDMMAHFYNTMTVSKELFGSIQCPVLLVSGELDRNAPLPTIINAYNMIPDCQLSIIPNTGHVVFLENFDAVWAGIVPFLND